jgi:membrane-associated phospholipid phosphatase
LINKSSKWAEFFNRFGELPSNIALLVGTSILYGNRNKAKKWKNIISSTIALPFMALFSFMICIVPINYTYEHTENGIPQSMFILAIVLGLILFIGSQIVIQKLGPTRLKSLKRIGLLLILVTVFSILIVNVLKIIWARPRMRFIQGIDDFKYWFQISGISLDNELKSFPSGHTANSFIMLALGFFITNLKQRKYFSIFAILWGIGVALSRVVLGAHFLSDVTVGGAITLLLIFVLEEKLLKKREEIYEG